MMICRQYLKRVFARPDIEITDSPLAGCLTPVLFRSAEPVTESRLVRRNKGVRGVLKLQDVAFAGPDVDFGSRSCGSREVRGCYRLLLRLAGCKLPLSALPRLAPHAAARKDHLAIGADLLERNQRRHLAPQRRCRIDHHNALGRRKPDLALRVFAAGWLIISAVAFASQHAVRFIVSHAVNLIAMACSRFVQLLPGHTIDPLQTAQP